MAEIHYVATGYVASAYYQTGISIDWLAKVIHVPKMFLEYVGPNAYTLDTNKFRLALTDIEDSEEGIAFSQTHSHNTTVTLAGVQYAQVLEILAPYTVTFEDGQYSVNLIGSNNNIGDKTNINQVSVRVNNSAGLQIVSTPTNVVTGTALTPEQTAAAVWGAAARTLTSGAAPTATDVATAVWAKALEGLTAEEMMRVMLAALAGKRQGLGTATEQYMAQDGITPRITLAADEFGNGEPVVDGTA